MGAYCNNIRPDILFSMYILRRIQSDLIFQDEFKVIWYSRTKNSIRKQFDLRPFTKVGPRYMEFDIVVHGMILDDIDKLKQTVVTYLSDFCKGEFIVGHPGDIQTVRPSALKFEFLSEVRICV